MLHVICLWRWGSPPPTRGTLSRASSCHLFTGITPAYAGNTALPFFVSFLMRDHPRLRGEHIVPQNNWVRYEGSPPPTRGTPSPLLQPISNIGITPAYAGNTNYILPYVGWFRDHPRLRGEHYLFLIFSERLRGSPPPTRGTRGRNMTAKNSFGITPAYAGNTPPNSHPLKFSRDHPRLRGEHFLKYANSGISTGSPPPTRGTRKRA